MLLCSLISRQLFWLRVVGGKLLPGIGVFLDVDVYLAVYLEIYACHLVYQFFYTT